MRAKGAHVTHRRAARGSSQARTTGKGACKGARRSRAWGMVVILLAVLLFKRVATPCANRGRDRGRETLARVGPTSQLWRERDGGRARRERRRSGDLAQRALRIAAPSPKCRRHGDGDLYELQRGCEMSSCDFRRVLQLGRHRDAEVVSVLFRVGRWKAPSTRQWTQSSIAGAVLQSRCTHDSS